MVSCGTRLLAVAGAFSLRLPMPRGSPLLLRYFTWKRLKYAFVFWILAKACEGGGHKHSEAECGEGHSEERVAEGSGQRLEGTRKRVEDRG